LDLRSAVSREACRVLVSIANQAGISFAPIVERLTNNSEAVFPKLLCAGSKLIKDCAEECLKELYQCVQSPKLLQGLLELQKSKNKDTRGKAM
jgi:hypothetical protein